MIRNFILHLSIQRQDKTSSSLSPTNESQRTPIQITMKSGQQGQAGTPQQLMEVESECIFLTPRRTACTSSSSSTAFPVPVPEDISNVLTGNITHPQLWFKFSWPGTSKPDTHTLHYQAPSSLAVSLGLPTYTDSTWAANLVLNTACRYLLK